MPPTPGGWVVRPATPADVGGLLALYQRVFGRTMAREQWEWKLGRCGPVPNVWLAEQGGRIVFQYAGIPTRFRHRGGVVEAMVSVDTMTDPEFRRQGLLTEVGAATYRCWREAKVPFVVGLPNEQWGTRAAALGWQPVSELRWWVRWLRPLTLLAARLGLQRSLSREGPIPSDDSTVRGVELREISAFEPGDVDALGSRIAAEGVIRDAAWLRWRYLEAVPSWKVLGLAEAGALVGACAFRLDIRAEAPSGLIGELLAPNPETRRKLLRGVSLRLRALGACRVAMLIQTGSPLEPEALAAGFLTRPETFLVQAVDLGGGLPLPAQFQGGDFDVL